MNKSCHSDSLNFSHHLVMQFVDSQEYSKFTRIVFDTTPTGHTLRLLTLPDFLDASFGKMMKNKGDWKKVAMIRKVMRDRGVKKEIGFSSADVGDTDDSSSLHGFLSDGKTHKQWEKIYKLAESLGSGMKLILKAGEDVALKV
ncbi:ATPase GET3B-like isoform X5 [Daucus carota subsp. sativus]|uniref:ATPase GET3B-like isoform X5 n=1 Tax=Daucus carota subsp. sativus TaxID=79200 RepID=UPI0030833C8C